MENVKSIARSLLNRTVTTAKGALTATLTFLKNPENLKYVIGGAIALVIISIFVTTVSKYSKGSGSGNKIVVAPPKATTNLNKEFSFPLKDDKGSTVSNLKYTIESAELTDEFVVKGQIARSVKGRVFVLLNIKIVNDFDKEIQIKTADYVRLSVNGNKTSWQAPDAHNDPVMVAAISTKAVKLGFAINDSDKDLLLRVGEINGQKTEVVVSFK